jgi:uncharacterized protein (UPF0147 family)
VITVVKTKDVIEMINEIMEDPTLPKNIKANLDCIVNNLKDAKTKDLKLKADKCIHDLEDISSDVNLQPFIRTQLWSIVSMLEALD